LLTRLGKQPDRVFMPLHGNVGEAGSIQGCLRGEDGPDVGERECRPSARLACTRSLAKKPHTVLEFLVLRAFAFEGTAGLMLFCKTTVKTWHRKSIFWAMGRGNLARGFNRGDGSFGEFQRIILRLRNNLKSMLRVLLR